MLSHLKFPQIQSHRTAPSSHIPRATPTSRVGVPIEHTGRIRRQELIRPQGHLGPPVLGIVLQISMPPPLAQFSAPTIFLPPTPPVPRSDGIYPSIRSWNSASQLRNRKRMETGKTMTMTTTSLSIPAELFSKSLVMGGTRGDPMMGKLAKY